MHHERNRSPLRLIVSVAWLLAIVALLVDGFVR